MATRSKRIVYEDEKRHKCSRCGAVRYESKMRKLTRAEAPAQGQFGNDKKQWICKNKCWRKC